MGFDSTFEMKFSQLVDSRLQEKVPSLYPSRVGFQLIDVNDEQDMGVGVMAFIVNGSWMYVPAFFLKGQLKGLDLLYVKSRDMFVPLKDNWISFLQKNEVKKLGKSVDKEDVESQKPNMINLVLSPHEKISNAKDSLIDMPTLGKMMVKMAEQSRDLVSEIPRMGKVALECFVRTMESNPDFANAIFEFYTPGDLKKIAATLDARSIDGTPDRKSSASDPERVSDAKAADADSDINKAIVESIENANPKTETVIVVETDVSAPSSATVADAKDSALEVPAFANDEVSKVPNKEQELLVVTSPSSPMAETLTPKEKEILIRDGVYIKDNRTKTTTVFNADINMSKFSNPTSTGFYEILMRDGECVPMLVLFPNVVKDGDEYACCSISHRAVCPENKVAVIDPATPEKCWMMDANRILGAPAAKLPEELYNKLKSVPEFTRTAYAQEGGYSRMLLVDGKRNSAVVTSRGCGDLLFSDTIDKVRFTGKEGKLYRHKGLLYVPNGTLGFRIENRQCPYQLGDANTFMYHMKKTAGLSYMKIYSDRNGFAISSDKTSSLSMHKRAALLHLVQKHGIQAPLAKKMLKEASERTGSPQSRKYLLKYADMFDLNAGDPRGSAGTIPQAPLENEYDTLPAKALETATLASQKGVKEVMDTSVLAALAGTSHSMELMGTYLADMIKAMDKIGRLLFLFYWHQQEFKDQYGQQELIELEESLRSVFASTGDLILFLKEKSVDFDSLFSGNRDDIAEDIG